MAAPSTAPNTGNGTQTGSTIGKERIHTIQEQITMETVALDIGTKEEG